MEIIITIIIVSLAISILFKTFKKSLKGNCSCGSCSNHCPMYQNKDNSLKIEKANKKS